MSAAMRWTGGSRIWAPLGGFRVQLGWRLIGFAMCQVLTGDRLWPHLAGFLLLSLGPRLITLALASASGIALIASLLTYPLSAEMSVAEEHLVFAALPLIALVFDLASRGDRAGAASSQLLLLRWSAILLMFFVGFHKLNADFFDDAVSCNTYLGGRLDLAWAIPLSDLGLLPRPATVVGLELGASLLLLLAPRAGIVLTAGLLCPIALFGPTSLVSTVLALASSGLRSGDGPVIWAGLRRRAIVVAMLCLGVAAIVYLLYEGYAPIRMLLFMLVASTLLFSVGLSVVNDPRGRPRNPMLPAPGPMRALVIGFVACGLINGFSPYLGTKFRMSFAMFSNLRVDEARWNHFLVPGSLYLRSHDPFVRVEQVDFVGPSKRLREIPSGPRDDRELRPSLLSPQSLRFRVETLRARRADAHLSVSYRGRRIRFPNVTRNREFRVWLSELPDAKLFQRKLERSGPQSCVH